MSDLGIKISQVGHDVEGGDVNLVFSSSWPVLRVIKAGEMLRVTETLTTITHNLNFVPMIMAWGQTVDGQLDMQRVNIFVDNKSIYWSHPGSGTVADNLHLIVFDVDIEKEYHAPKVNVSTSSNATTRSDVGIRYTVEGKDVSSKDLRDYILHSSTRSPMLHAVVPLVPNVVNASAPNTRSASYQHDLPYNPIFMVYAQTTVSGVSGTPYGLMTNFAGVTTSGNTISITGVDAGNKASIVIMKDPFDIDNNAVSVSI